jgi:hypothetical protein
MSAPVVTPLPAQPGVSGPFDSDEADAFVGAWPAMIEESNAQAAYRGIHDPIVEIDGLAAQNLADPPIWVTDTDYERGDVAWSPTDWQDYVRLTDGAGSTDPASDPANWQLVTGTGDSTLTGTETWTNKTLKNVTLQGAVTETIHTITDGASVEIDPADGSIQIWYLGADREPTAAATWANGQEIAMLLYGGGWDIDWDTIGVTWVNGIEPSLTIERYAWIVLSKRGGAFEGKYAGESAAGYLTLDLNFLLGTLDSRITFTRGSAGTRVNASGVIESIATNLPRFDYDPDTLEPLGLLIEGQRTNLLLNSLIDGTNLSTQDVPVAAVAHTLTFYGTGTVTLSGVSTAGPLAGTGAFPARVTLPFTPTAGTLTLTVSGDVKFAQLEAGSFATSFIPTAGSTVTRSADVASMTGSAFSGWWNESEGTFLAEFDCLSPTATRAILGAYENGTNYFEPYIDSAARGRTFVIDGNVQQAHLASTATVSASVPAKLASAYKANDFAQSLNGTGPDTDVSGSLPSPTELHIGHLGGGSHLNGHIRRIRHYRTRLPNSTLQSLTS